MRAALLLIACVLTGCQAIVGLEDPVGGECALFSTDECPANHMCDFDQDLDRTACRAIGAAPYGAPCDGQTDCSEGLSCTDGLCRTLCNDNDQCTESDQGECLWSKGTALVCDSSCNVIDTGSCGVGFECEISFNQNGALTSACVPTHWFGDVEMGGECDDLTSCVEGLACIDVDEDGTGVCMPLCVLGGDGCPASTACDFGIGTLHGTDLGICRP